MAYRNGDGAVLGGTDSNKRLIAYAAPPHFLPISIPAIRPGLDRRWPQSAFPELDCVHDRLPPHVIAAVEHRAAEIGIGAERVLIASGFMDEDHYVYALARSLGLEYETFDGRDRACCPLTDQRLLLAAEVGLLPLMIDGQEAFVLAPHSARQFIDLVRRYPRARFRLTSLARLNLFIADKGRAAVANEATSALRSRWPRVCAGHSDQRFRAVAAALLALLVGALVASAAILVTVQAMLAVSFLAALGLRLFGSYLAPPLSPTQRIPDRELPVYTVIVALYRERKAVAGLIASLRELDYPPEKLDIKFVIEPDDLETWHALADVRLSAPFEIIIAPQELPRTKPKALNTALLFARGAFTVVFDAEDRPERDQLRRAFAMFQANGPELACVQAALTIDNTKDSWLARLFTAEYAAQFDLFLPGLATLRLPLPLGGSSNHFRTAVLHKVGAWDPYNVTEDADLGMRLARFGYRATVIDSTTYEEAPARIGAWLRQRTRWMKGWMQTWAVHMRTPRLLLDELGPTGFLTFQLMVGGNVLAALIHPVLLGSFAYAAVTGYPILSAGEPSIALTSLFATSLIAGYVISISLGLRGLARRGLLPHAWALAFVPVHWALLSLAAWRAVYQLMRDPQGWEKTEHGLAKSSRRVQTKNTTARDVAFEKPEPKLRSAA